VHIFCKIISFAIVGQNSGIKCHEHNLDRQNGTIDCSVSVACSQLKDCRFPGLFFHFASFKCSTQFAINPEKFTRERDLPPDGLHLQGCADTDDMDACTTRLPELEGKTYGELCRICNFCTTDLCNDERTDGGGSTADIITNVRDNGLLQQDSTINFHLP
jgi:hypothetical protein